MSDQDEGHQPPAAPASGNDNGLANDLRRLEAGAQLAGEVPPEVAALQQQQAAAQVSAVAEWEALLVGLAQPTFDVFAPNWKVKPNETEAWAKGVAPCMAKYFPDVSASVEVTAIVCTLVVFGPRITTPLKAPEEKPA